MALELSECLQKLNQLKHLSLDFWVACNLSNDNFIQIINAIGSISYLQSLSLLFLKTQLSEASYDEMSLIMSSLKGLKSLKLHFTSLKLLNVTILTGIISALGRLEDLEIFEFFQTVEEQELSETHYQRLRVILKSLPFLKYFKFMRSSRLEISPNFFFLKDEFKDRIYF